MLVLCQEDPETLTNLLFTSLKDIAVLQEERLHLIDTTGGNKNEVEDGKEPQLKRESSVSNHPEGKSTEQCRKDMKNDFVPHVVLCGR